MGLFTGLGNQSGLLKRGAWLLTHLPERGGQTDRTIIDRLMAFYIVCNSVAYMRRDIDMCSCATHGLNASGLLF